MSYKNGLQLLLDAAMWAGRDALMKTLLGKALHSVCGEYFSGGRGRARCAGWLTLTSQAHPSAMPVLQRNCAGAHSMGSVEGQIWL